MEHFLFKLLILISLFSFSLLKKHVFSPPKILEQSNGEIAFKQGEEVQLRCIALGRPSPSYYWQKDDRPLNLVGLGIRQIPGEGTILIEKPQLQHEGLYQCFAKNEFGTALSVKILLKKAYLDSFPTIRDVITHRPLVGQSLILPCIPPTSYPSGPIYWGENKNESKLRPIENNDRISLDYKGNLYFSNIDVEDSRNGVIYVCIVHNLELRSLVQGDDQKIEPQLGRLRHEPPKLMWFSGSSDVAIRGQTKRIKCIFSGYPTPVVQWFRLDGKMSAKAENGSHGQEVVLWDVDFSDAGRYQCRAKNSDSSPMASKEITITVESAPYWRDNSPPSDVNTSEDEPAEFKCLVNGVPRPTINWYINGIPIKDFPSNPKKKKVPTATLR